MNQLLSAKNILLTALCFSLGCSLVSAKKMYRWVDKNGKVSFSDQVPPSQAELKEVGHEELDKGRVVNVVEKAKTPEQLEQEKQLMLLKAEQEKAANAQQLHDKELLSNFLDLNAMDARYNTQLQAFNYQEQELQNAIKKSGEELLAQQQEAASFEIKNTKIPPAALAKIAENQKKLTKLKEDIKHVQLKKVTFEQEFAVDRARFKQLTESKTTSAK